jgi:hypothetical protein
MSELEKTRISRFQEETLRNRYWTVVLIAAIAVGIFVEHVFAGQTAAPMVSGVWALDMPTVALGDPYGNQEGAAGAAANLAAMERDGIGAVAAGCFTNPSALIPIMTAADQTGGIRVAPVIDLSILYRVRPEPPAQLQAAAEQAIVGYCRLAAAYGCAARTPNGRAIVWVFGTHQLAAAQWQSVLGRVHAAKWNPFVIGDTSGPAPWDARWSFVAGKTPLITTLMPQYTRPGQKIDLPTDGGARYRRQWAAAISAKTPAALIVSWNDTGDGSEIAGQSDLEQITAAESGVWKEEAK